MPVLFGSQRKQFSIFAKMLLGPSDIAWVEDLVSTSVKLKYIFLLLFVSFSITFLPNLPIYLIALPQCSFVFLSPSLACPALPGIYHCEAQ